MSHELRRPLAAILGWTRLLRSGRSADIARGLEVIARSANQQRLLIEELLDLSRTTSVGSPPSARRITLSLSSADCDAIVEVADTGVGISASELRKLFEPFWQADVGSSRFTREGLGIGLTIVRRLVELHEGTIDVKSGRPGCGTRMIVRLPLEAREQQ